MCEHQLGGELESAPWEIIEYRLSIQYIFWMGEMLNRYTSLIDATWQRYPCGPPAQTDRKS